MRMIVLAAVFSCAAVAPLQGQLTLEVRGGAAVGNHRPAAAGLQTRAGASLSGSVEVTPFPFVSLYAAYIRSSFRCEEGFCTDLDVRVTTSGFGGGARLRLPRLPWIRAGIAQLATKVRSDLGEENLSRRPAVDLGVGGSVRLNRTVELVPGVAYRSHLNAEDRTSTLSAELGVRVAI